MADHVFAAFVGLDWGAQQHAVCLAAGGQRVTTDLAQQVEDIEAWAADLRLRFEGRPIAVCLEQARGALVYALLKYEFLVLFPINPKQLASYRDAFVPCGPKDDPTDAELLCLFVEQHHTRLRAWRPDDASTRILRLLSEDRRRWVDERTALKNRLRQRLTEYFPLALALGSEIDACWFLQLLKKYPSHSELRRAHPRVLARLLPKRSRVADDQGEDTRVVLIRSSAPLVTDPAVILTHRLDVLHMVRMLIQLNDTVAEYDREIARHMAEHCDGALFQSFPAAGAAMAPRLAAAFGTDRERFSSAQEMQQLSGIAPVLKRSGKSCSVIRRLACPKFLRQTFHEYADHSRKQSAWAAAYYRLLKARGKGHHCALRSLAFKWQRIMYRCWKTRTLYDEAAHLQQLRLRNSPLLAYLQPTNDA
jgi:transposase